MRARQSIAEMFPKYLFWDMDYSALDVQKDKNIIIPRALIATTPDSFTSDISKLESIYKKEQIISALRNTKERISNKICSMVAERYHVEEFARFAK
jgi:hypothetical protein